MKILLIFPPQWVPYGPFLSLPSLAAYLAANGFPVTQKDFNIESYDLLLSERYLNKVADIVADQFDNLGSKKKLDFIEQKLYNDLFLANVLAPKMTSEVEKAKATFRSQTDFYDIDKLARARRTLDAALNIISQAYFPASLSLSSFDVRGSGLSIQELEKLTTNRQQNPYIELYRDYLLPCVREQKADLIGISIICSSQLIPGLTLARLLKESGCQAHIVVGGSVITHLSETISRSPELFTTYFDSAVFFEGERPLLELAKRLESGQDLRGVPNLAYFDQGEIRVNESAPPEKIDRLPTPSFDGLPLNLYLSPEPVLPVLASRGCYWGKCAFCSHGLIYHGHYQKRSASCVVEDLKNLSARYKTTYFAFSDEGIAPNVIDDLSAAISASQLAVKCSASIRFEKQFTPQLCARAAGAGFKEVFLGLESACDRVLGYMRKGITMEAAREVCRNLFRAGIWNHVFAFFGFPTETRAEARETIDFLLTNKDIIRSFSTGHFVLSRGSPTEKNPEIFGISHITRGRGDDLTLSFDYSVSSGLDNKQAREMSELEVDNLYHEYPSNELIKVVGQDNLLLYLGHFEKADPFLQSVKCSGERPRPPAPASFSNFSIPRLKDHLVVASLNFDICQIGLNIKNDIPKEVAATRTSVLYDTQTGGIIPISESAREILAFCDGGHTVAQLVQTMAARHHAPVGVVFEDCKEFLAAMAASGYIS